MNNLSIDAALPSFMSSSSAGSSFLFSHLPKQKQRELQRAVAIICEISKPDLLILFGSYVRGDWVDTLEYGSGFDLLAIFEKTPLALKMARKNSLYTRLQRELVTPVNIISEGEPLIHRYLRKDQYFYREILQEGVVLQNTGKCQLLSASDLSVVANAKPIRARRKQQAEMDFSHWFHKAMRLKKSFALHFLAEDYSEAAFLLHQIVERLYSAMLLVFSGYKPAVHDLEQLNQLATSFEPLLLPVFSRRYKADQTRFQLLRRAYVDARYAPNFFISRHDLILLTKQVWQLQCVVKEACQARIASYDE